ncbi:MAG: ABC transporter substrate-binding protein [Lachnospiraceae bacterium]|nr:ABC transporter substrate-binding protein [Lachnospiraceae bacterium]
MKKKQIVAILCSLSLAVSMMACSSSSSTESGESSSSESTQTASEDGDTSSEADAGEDASAAVAASVGAVNIYDLMDPANIDTSRKSTYNSDETLPELTVYTKAEITTWAPWQPGQGRNGLIELIYEPLFYTQYTEDGFNLEPCLAKDWYDEDETHMVVEIYDYIHDSDGNNITAEDVVAAYEILIESGNYTDFDYFESVEAIDDYTVRFTWTKEIDSITALGSMMGTLIYSQQAYADHDFTTDPVGTGTYEPTELVTGTKYVVEPTDYWQTDESVRTDESIQNVDVFTTEVINDNSVAYIAFEEGSIYQISPSTVQLTDFLEGGKYYGEYTLSYQYSTGVYGLGFNLSGESTVSDDLNLRLAIAYAIDGEGIVEAIGSTDHAAVHAEASSSIIGYQDVWDSMENYYSVYDVDLAKEYLAESNYNGETLHIIMRSGREANDTAVQIIQQELNEIGVTVQIDAYEDAIVNSYLYDATCWDMYFYIANGDPISQLWSRLEDLDNFSHGYTATGVNDPVLQEMIDNVQTVDGFTDENIQEIQQYFTDNCMLYSIWSNVSWNVYQPNIARICTLNGHDRIFYTASDYYLD